MPTVQEALDRIWSDEGLKQRLVSNPKPVLKEFGLNIPENVKVHIHENTPELMNAVLPVKPSGEIPQANDPISRAMQRAWTDSAFKSKLLSNPKEALPEVGLNLPEAVNVKVYENTPTDEHMVIPMNPTQAELSDVDLESVAGGGLSKGLQWSTGCGAGAAAAGIGGAALAFTAVGAAIGFGVAGGIAGGVSTAGGAVSSGSGKC